MDFFGFQTLQCLRPTPPPLIYEQVPVRYMLADPHQHLINRDGRIINFQVLRFHCGEHGVRKQPSAATKLSSAITSAWLISPVSFLPGSEN